MKVFFARSAEHLAPLISLPKGASITRSYSDGEVSVRIKENVKGENVWVVAHTLPPAENILELLFLLDALHRQGAVVSLFIAYFGYGRQDRIDAYGECLSIRVIADCLKLFPVKRTVVLHPHSLKLREFLDHEGVVPADILKKAVSSIDVILAPDKGAESFARAIAKKYKRGVAVLEKKRISDTQVEVVAVHDHLKGKSVLIVDDMISTGGTLIKTTEELLRQGVKEVFAYATHGILCGDARKNIANSKLKAVYVTNSLPVEESEKIKVIDIAPVIQKWLKK
jgi:ribose-phosphate pyrophosphokinase